MAMRGSTLLLLSQNLRDLHDETIVRTFPVWPGWPVGCIPSRLVVDEEPSPLDVKLVSSFSKKPAFCYV